MIVGELPFQPYAGTRKNRTIMKRILDTKPPGYISGNRIRIIRLLYIENFLIGIENSPGGDIQWSKVLPDSCRLSNDLKRRLEILLQRLLEADRNKLMTFREFFRATDYLFQLMPIYYLNLKRFILTCTYFEPTESTMKLYEQLQKQNDDRNNEEYYCLFQK